MITKDETEKSRREILVNFEIGLNRKSLVYCYNLEFNRGGIMVNEGRGRLFRRKDGKYLIYLPVDFVEDSMFPFKVESSAYLKVAFN